ncbi:hypothetical protein DWU98_21425 [Dyella monticola]|uniref:Uncharacterized protein n=2 Tax=Dyella monticola TaxID=1927958 RepID=A0A370WRR5_9GAMM|nr:hypothetical protein DWU98_21425 [Dyella monticola]
MLISFISFKNLLLEKIDWGEDLVLVGRQIERSKDQAGTLLALEGVRILRITPSYLVSIDMPFQPSSPKEARDDIIKDMINLVESVHVTTNP